MTVRLSLLDKLSSLSYTDQVPVSIYDVTYREIGMCRIYRDVKGDHFGILDLKENVDPDFYFYYRSRVNNEGIFVFSGLEFMPTQQEKNPTKKLREMILFK